jgi:hypothetical protein
VDGSLHNLDRCIITGIDSCVCWEWDLRQAESAGVRVLRGTDNLENWHHRVGHVRWSAIWAISAKSQVHVEECSGVALEPAGLERDCSSVDGPFCTVGGCGHAAA